MPALQFKPPWWAIGVTAVLCSVFVSLSMWQLSRAEEKRELLEMFEAGREAPAEIRSSEDLDDRVRYAPLRVHGRFLPERQFLLEGQTRDGQTGFHVWTPFELEEGERLLMVDRGWIARQEAPPEAPDDEPRSIRGMLDELPEPGFRMDPPAPEGEWPREIYYPDAELLESQLERPVHPGRLLMDADETPGHVREWDPVAMPPERHLAYAFQWAALAVALLVVFIVVNTRRRRN